MTVSGQLIKDSVKIPRQDALRVLAAADSGRVYMRIAEQCAKDVDTLIKILNLRQSQINNLLNVDKSNQQAIELLKSQQKDYQAKIKSDEKLLLKERRKKKWALFGGTAILAYLLITK